MTPLAPLSSLDARRAAQVEFALAGLFKREVKGEGRFAPEERWRFFHDETLLEGLRPRLQHGTHPFWFSGQLQRWLSFILDCPPPSKETLLKGLGLLCDLGLIRQEWRGKRPGYRWVRRWEKKELEEFSRELEDSGFPWDQILPPEESLGESREVEESIIARREYLEKLLEE